MLAELPPELRRELDETTLVGNREVIFEVIERIRAHAPAAAESLRVLVENFEIERIGKFLFFSGCFTSVHFLAIMLYVLL